MDEKNELKELKFCDKILDNVHGFIQLTRVEQRIVELPIFKRLQGIKQLSLVNWIFPGSEHTRYIHSLGVMHIADKMAIQLGYSAEERQLVRLAGLLHDIGHYPLSHVCETAYKNNSFTSEDTIVGYCKASVKRQIDDITKSIIKVNYMTKANDKFHHERIGESIIKSDEMISTIISEECPNIVIEDICDIITGNVERNKELSDKVQLMHSEIDADGIDYMLRDGTFSGTSFGNFEVSQLISSLDVTTINGVKIVGVNPKGIPAADQYLINKFFSYKQVIFNKHTSVLGYMAETVAFYLRYKSAGFPDQKRFEGMWVANHKDNNFFLRFTDDYFWKTLHNLEPYNGLLPNEILKFTDNLLSHKGLKWNEGCEVKIISRDLEEISKCLTASEMYKRLSENDSNVALFYFQSITKHIPEEMFVERIKKKKDEEGQPFDDTLLNSLKISRWQEGVAVIDNGIVKLLCDDNRSMMRQLYNVRCAIMREYSLE